MSAHPNQLGFEWLDTSLGAATLNTPVNKPRKPRRVASLPASAAALSLDDMARALEASGDYKVLRRLVPVDHYPSPSMATMVQRVAIIDTETTGLQAAQDRIIELAVIVVDVDVQRGCPVGPVHVFDGFEDPGRPLSPDIVSLTGITDDMVRGQHLDEAQLAKVMQGVTWVVAHNAAFDRPFVESRLPQFAALPWACSFADIDWKGQGRSSAKLEALAADAGWFYDAHRADADCHALLTVLTQTLSDGQTGLARLWMQSQAPQFRLAAVGAPFETKDVLKARGYRWDSNARVWSLRIAGEQALAQERQWLAQHVYANPRAPIRIEVQDAYSRYSARVGDVRLEPLWLDSSAGSA